MSTTATAFDLKQYLIDNLNRIGDMYASDFGHIPADKACDCPMGKARTATEFTAECAGFNLFVAGLVRGGAEGRTEEERKAYYASLNTGPKAIEALNGSVQSLKDAISQASDEDLFKEVAMPWGDTVPLHRAISMTTSHMMYHDGQINYIQALYGDNENHWA